MREGLRRVLASDADAWQSPPLSSGRDSSDAKPARTITAIAVTPFKTFGEAAAAVSDAMTDDLTNILSRVPALRVISRQTNAIPYSKVTDLTFRQGVMDRVLSIARVRIDSANETSPFRELTDLTNHSLFMYTLSTMVNIRQAPHRSGTRQQVFTEPKKIKILDELLDQIEGYLARSGTKASMFGRQAVGDPRFVQDLREGRQPRLKTTQRVLNFLASTERVASTISDRVDVLAD